MRVIGLIGTIAYILVILAAGMVNRSLHQQSTPTPTPIMGYLDNGQPLVCYVLADNPIFQTATAAPTKTTIPIASATLQATSTLPTPTQEIWTPAPPRMTVQIAAINVRNAASLTGTIQYVVTQGQVLNVTSNTVTAGGYIWRQLTDSNWLVEKVVSSGQVWLSPV